VARGLRKGTSLRLAACQMILYAMETTQEQRVNVGGCRRESEHQTDDLRSVAGAGSRDGPSDAKRDPHSRKIQWTRGELLCA